jgi:hypothetical protein
MPPPPHMRHPKKLVQDPSFGTYLVARGVPQGVLHSTTARSWESLVTRIDYDPAQRVAKTVSRKQQIQFLRRTIENPFERNYLFCLSGETDKLPIQLALEVFVAALKQGQGDRKPLWHMVTGFPRDELRDTDPDTLNLKLGGHPSFLVLSNIAANSTTMKLEKVRDLLNRYSHVPRLLVVGGENPITFCSRALAMSVNRVIYFGFKDNGGDN